MLVVISKTDTLPVTLEQVKAQARIESNDEDAVTRLHLAAAIDYCERHTQRVLRQAVIELRVEDWTRWWNADLIEIPITPVRSIDSVVYIDEDGNEQTVDAADYGFELTEEGANLWFVPGFTYPVLHATSFYPVRVRANAGYDDPEESGSGDDPMLRLPEVIQHAIAMLVAHWHEFREAVTTVQMQDVPIATRALLDQVRVLR